MFFIKLCQALSQAKVAYAVVGGFAVALHGAVRGTVDVDIVLDWTLENLKAAEMALKNIGLVSRLPLQAQNVYTHREDYITNRNLIAWNFYNPVNPIEQVDLIISYDLRSAKTKLIETSLAVIPVLSREDLIAMKKISGRPQDLEDIRALEEL